MFAFPKVRRCCSCGESLVGRPAFRVSDVYSCLTVKCLSKAYVDNLSSLKPEEEEMLATALGHRRYLEQYRYQSIHCE